MYLCNAARVCSLELTVLSMCLKNLVRDNAIPPPVDQPQPATKKIVMRVTFVSCFVNAFLGRYTSNKFMREAIEVHLGRDSADFVWWDRRGDKNDNRPKKPKKPKN